jgi:hypothetical protein
MIDNEDDTTIDLFQSYELEYNELIVSIRNNLTKLADTPLQNANEFETLQRKIKRHLDMVESIVTNMEGELSTLRKHKALNQLREQLDTYKRDVRQTRAEYQRLLQKILLDDPIIDSYSKQQKNSRDADDRYYDSDDSDMDLEYSSNRKDRLYETKRLLDRSSDTLQNTLRIANEIESRGHDILGTLVDQRGIIQRARDRLSETNESIWASRRILSRMEWRQFLNRCILVTAIVVLVGAILLYLVYSIQRRFGSSS